MIKGNAPRLARPRPDSATRSLHPPDGGACPTMSIARCVSKIMDRIAPLTLAEKWDNVSYPSSSPTKPSYFNFKWY